jgi:hypothetical protein
MNFQPSAEFTGISAICPKAATCIYSVRNQTVRTGSQLTFCLEER